MGATVLSAWKNYTAACTTLCSAWASSNGEHGGRFSHSDEMSSTEDELSTIEKSLRALTWSSDTVTVHESGWN